MVEKDPRAVAEAAFDREQMREREVSGQRRAEARGGAPRRGRRDHAPAAGAQPVAWTVESVRGAALKGGPERAGALALLSTLVTDGIARLTSALTPISPREQPSMTTAWRTNHRATTRGERPGIAAAGEPIRAISILRRAGAGPCRTGSDPGRARPGTGPGLPPKQP